MRIVGGSLRGSRLEVPDLPGLRPTPDRVRETLFNWLAPVIDGARCLDLCAGTGALGIEALSRGAASVQFVERDRALAQALRDNLARLKVDGGAGGRRSMRGLFCAARRRRYDLVFLDPPFALDLWSALARQLERRLAGRAGVDLRRIAARAWRRAAGELAAAPRRPGRRGAFCALSSRAADPLS